MKYTYFRYPVFLGMLFFLTCVLLHPVVSRTGKEEDGLSEGDRFRDMVERSIYGRYAESFCQTNQCNIGDAGEARVRDSLSLVTEVTEADKENGVYTLESEIRGYTLYLDVAWAYVELSAGSPENVYGECFARLIGHTFQINVSRDSGIRQITNLREGIQKVQKALPRGSERFITSNILNRRYFRNILQIAWTSLKPGEIQKKERLGVPDFVPPVPDIKNRPPLKHKVVSSKKDSGSFSVSAATGMDVNFTDKETHPGEDATYQGRSTFETARRHPFIMKAEVGLNFELVTRFPGGGNCQHKRQRKFDITLAYEGTSVD